jgi:hypothetical protein
MRAYTLHLAADVDSAKKPEEARPRVMKVWRVESAVAIEAICRKHSLRCVRTRDKEEAFILMITCSAEELAAVRSEFNHRHT